MAPSMTTLIHNETPATQGTKRTFIRKLGQGWGLFTHQGFWDLKLSNLVYLTELPEFRENNSIVF